MIAGEGLDEFYETEVAHCFWGNGGRNFDRYRDRIVYHSGLVFMGVAGKGVTVEEAGSLLLIVCCLLVWSLGKGLGGRVRGLDRVDVCRPRF